MEHTASRHSKSTLILSSLLLFCGIATMLSTFFEWLVYMGTQVTGWEYMASTHPLSTQPGKSILFCHIWGSLWFTGFWSLLFGSLIVLGAYLVYRGMRSGGILSLLIGLAGSSLAIVNVLASRTFERVAFEQAEVVIISGIGYGLLVFMIASALAVVLGAISLLLLRKV